MPDPYMDAMMHGLTAVKKTDKGPLASKKKIDLIQEKKINKYIDSLDIEAQLSQNQLVTPAMKRAQIREEIKTSAKLPELSEQISASFDLLAVSGARYMNETAYQKMLKEFSAIDSIIDKLDFEDENQENFQVLLKISDSVMNSVLQMAVMKFNEEDFPGSLSLMVLLTTLNSGVYDYWFRLGIVAQKNENFPLALRAYAAALELEPQLIGAHLFSFECYLEQKDSGSAKEALQKAKNLLLSPLSNEAWVKLYKNAEATLMATI